MQAPLLHTSSVVQASPSSQELPFCLFGLLQTPVEGSQTPVTWHCATSGSGLLSAGRQAFWVPTHTPAWQVSLMVQSRPSLQEVPVSGGSEQMPVVVEMVPAAWH